MSLFRNKFSMSEARDNFGMRKTQSYKIVKRKRIFDLDLIPEDEVGYKPRNYLETEVPETKLRKVNTIEYNGLSTVATTTRATSIITRKPKCVKFSDPLVSEVIIESHKQYFFEPLVVKRKKTEHCRCLIY
jgi:hypothetical protein